MEHFVCIENETPSQMSYGRVIALIALAGLIATRLSDMKCFGEISLIMSHTSKFLQKRIALTWTHHNRSWVSFCYNVIYFYFNRRVSYEEHTIILKKARI